MSAATMFSVAASAAVSCAPASSSRSRRCARTPGGAAFSARPTGTSPGRRTGPIARVGQSGTNKFTGEPEWVEVSDATAAIGEGQELYDAKDYAAAITKWEGALKLGGSGTKRDRAKPAELSLGERQAIYYNLVCAHSTVGDADKGCAALEAAFRSGYGSADLYGFGKANEDYERLMRDADLANLRADPRFGEIVKRYRVEPTEMQLQLDPSQSVLGRALKMWGGK